MATENRGVALRHLQTVLTAGAIGSLPDGALAGAVSRPAHSRRCRFLGEAGLVEAAWAVGAGRLPGRAAQPS